MYPELRLTQDLVVPTYFLIISMACMTGTAWFLKRASLRHLERLTAIDLTLTCLVAGFLGARLLHVVFEDPEHYLAQPVDALKIWNGGFVFFGGLLAAAVAAFLFCRIRQEPFWYWADTAALPAAWGYAIGRLGCFFNGCCYGKLSALPWAIEVQGGHRHPTQIYATVWELLVLFLLRWWEPRIKSSGVLFNLWLLGHSGGRLAMELFRDDPRGPWLRGLPLGTWISLALILFASGQLALHFAEKRHS